MWRLRFPKACRHWLWALSAAFSGTGLFALAALPAALPAEGGDETFAPFSAPGVVPRRLTFPTLLVRRDPFAVEDDLPPVDQRPVTGDDVSGIVLPPNAGATALVIRAIVLGESPKALVDVAGRTLVVGVGTPLAGSNVASITENEIVLQDGERFRLREKQP